MKNILEKIIYLGMICCFLSYFQAQNYSGQVGPQVIPVPPSPDVKALTRYGTIPISPATGVPDISIPFYNINAGSLSFPITLSYHASGIKARDIASVAGLGWSLNYGGIIAKTTYGESDEQNLNYYSVKNAVDLENLKPNCQAPQCNRTQLALDFHSMKKQYFETESDRYVYNFAGHTGAFRYDVDGIVHKVPYSPIIINKKYLNNTISPANLYYEIIDENGNTFEFKERENSWNSGRYVVSAYKLTKVISANGQDEINFYYSDKDERILELNPSNMIIAGNKYPIEQIPKWTPEGVIYCNAFGSETFRVDAFDTTTISTSQNTHLDSIVSKDTRIRFDYLTDRTDGRKIRINKISIFNKFSNELIKKFDFDQSYFGNLQSHTLRLKLDGVRISGRTVSPAEHYTFEYDTTNEAPGYYRTPGYNYPGSLNGLPLYVSEDYWGYPNAGKAKVPAEFAPELTLNNYATLYCGNMNPNETLMKAYIIKAVHYPTGGRSEFEFEANRTTNPNFYGYQNQTNANNGIVGGLRIKKILNYASANAVPEIKEYKYSYPVAERTISSWMFRYNQQFLDAIFMDDEPSDICQGYTGSRRTGRVVYKSSAVIPLNFLDGNPLLYSEVTEFNGTENDNMGKTIYHYDIGINPGVEAMNIEVAPRFLSSFFFDYGPIDPLLTLKESYRNGEQTPFHTEGNTYKFLKENTSFTTGIKVDQFTSLVKPVSTLSYVDTDFKFIYHDNVFDATYLEDYIDSFHFENTKGFEDVRVLDKTVVTDRFAPDKVLTTTTTYNYDNLIHLQPTSKMTLFPDGKTSATQLQYAHEKGNQLMMNRNMVAIPLEATTSLTTNGITKTIAKTETVYPTQMTYPTLQAGTLVLPLSVKMLDQVTGNLSEAVTYDKYDSKGNIQQYTGKDGISTTIIWGYNQTQPIAKITGAKLFDISQSLIDSIVNASATDNTAAPGNDESAFLSVLDTFWKDANLANYQVTTYTYDPLIGVRSITPPSGIREVYIYDTANRLKEIREDNQSGKLLKEFKYNYKN